MKHYGIEIIGYGKRRRYAVKEIVPGRGTNPVCYCKTYKTEAEAREAARAYGFPVEAVGDFYALVAMKFQEEA